MSLYMNLARVYKWTISEIDNEELDDILDILVVLDKVENAPTMAFIDEVLPM